jgi:epoxide hydrolase-like predicted phosphatase
MIKTIIFDIGGVVAKTDFDAIYIGFAKKVGLLPEFIKAYHDKNFDELILGNIVLDQFWNDMVREGVNPHVDWRAIWVEEGIKNRKLNPELLAIIRRLRKKYSIGVLTNLTPARLLIDEKMNLYRDFDYALLSCEEHLQKPDHEFYQRALERAKAKPEEAIFVDDKESCTNAAEAIGIRSIIYKYPDNETFLKNLDALGVKP